MADKKPSKRSGAPGGDRPMRRRDSKTDAPREGARKTFASDKPKFEKPRGEKTGKPRFDKGAARPVKGKAAKPKPAPVEKTSAFEGERIAKAMARAGVCSRRDAEHWIAEGRVAVNGEVLTSPAVNVIDADSVTIDGAPMQARERTRLFLFHKPAGLVTTASDPEGRPTVFAYLEERHPDLPRLVSVGRLDINTEGLLLLTNDGGLARTLELPATGWTRRYRVRVHGETDQAKLDELKKGVTIDEVTYAPIDARLERVQGANAWIAMSLTEGKNREVKRVMEYLGLDVTRLIRVSYGPFQLGELDEGVVEEVKLKMLREQLGKSLAELAGVDFASPLREATAAEEQEKRERTDKRARKHVSVLRKQRDEQSEKGPRAKIERSATADRKGRAVAVERVTLTRRKAAAEEGGPASRNARRFDAMRGGVRKPREDARGAERSERPQRGERTERAERPVRSARGPREERFDREAGGRGGAARRAPDTRRTSRFEEGRAERPARAPRERGEERRDARPRGERSFERGASEAPRGRARAGGHSDERPNYRSRQTEEGRPERRPPRREGAEPGRDARPPRSAAGGRHDGARRFERPRGERDAGGAERAPRTRTFDRPREGAEGKPPRSGAGKGAPRSGARGAGPGKGPPRGRGAGPGRGPGKGPGRGPAGSGGRGGPRKPRGE